VGVGNEGVRWGLDFHILQDMKYIENFLSYSEHWL
jgi:hypothetical protein